MRNPGRMSSRAGATCGNVASVAMRSSIMRRSRSAAGSLSTAIKRQIRFKSALAPSEWRSSGTLWAVLGGFFRFRLRYHERHLQGASRTARFAFVPGAAKHLDFALTQLAAATPQAHRVTNRLARRGIFACFDRGSQLVGHGFREHDGHTLDLSHLPPISSDRKYGFDMNKTQRFIHVRTQIPHAGREYPIYQTPDCSDPTQLSRKSSGNHLLAVGGGGVAACGAAGGIIREWVGKSLCSPIEGPGGTCC